MIKIFKSSENYLVWTADEALKLRKDHRLTSPPVGCLPGCPLQNNTLSLPLLLSPCEARLAVEKGFAVMVNEDDVIKVKGRGEKVNRKRKLLYLEQIELSREEKLNQFESRMERIAEGKRKKIMKRIEKSKGNPTLQDSESKEDSALIAEAEMSRLIAVEVEKERSAITSSLLPEEASAVQIHTSRFPEDIINESSLLTLWQSPLERQEEIKYRVLRHFWEMKYFVSSGLKFGGDFLVYPGDPARFHSWFIVACMDRKCPDKLNKHHVVRLGRMATSVKKTFVLAVVDLEGSGSIECVSIQWRGRL